MGRILSFFAGDIYYRLDCLFFAHWIVAVLTLPKLAKKSLHERNVSIGRKE